MTNYRKKIFLVAYACEPNSSSEPGVGWNFSNEIAKEFDPIIITRANNKDEIETQDLGNKEFLYYDLPKFFLFFKNRIPLGTQLYYFFWQWGAYWELRKYLKNSKLKIQLLHHLNFGISWMAPPVFLVPLPFVWGPIGGGETIPWIFLKKMHIKAIVQESIYFCINSLNKVSITSFFTKKRTNALLFRTALAKEKLDHKNIPLVETISETASNFRIVLPEKHISDALHVICVGRMTYWKDYISAVQGFNEFLLNGGTGTLEFFGVGPEMSKIETFIVNNNLTGHVFIRGKVSNDIIKNKLKDTHIFLHPSFRDGGSWSIMEAMAYGLPVICLNTSGPKDMVTENCGILVDMVSPKQVSHDIGLALSKLFKDKESYQRLSRNAALRIKNEYNWDRRRTQIKEVYDKVLNKELTNGAN